MQIVDRREQILRNKVIPLVKVLWGNHGIKEATWESEAQMRSVTPRISARPDWRIRTEFGDARSNTGTPYLIFFFKTELVPVGMAHTYNNSKYYIQVKRTTT